ncbi:MAG: hypothetical protein B6U95_09335 [Thermofilum sp. ex4484_82]|nr:MAG: hypothetical protein B6U95_09335 [Thermofilum sp. ex4484_82]OYT35867.1 MAG: hypothetical protein B6U96_09345 [Archaeoglobales archaeon ex4484_92]
MKSPFSRYGIRLELLHKLKEKGFYVRMHAYEYIIGDYKRFHAIVFLEPEKNYAFIKVLGEKEVIKEIEELIVKLDPNIHIEEI